MSLIDYKIKGGKELDDLLKRLPIEVETKILKNALAAGANVIRDQAKANIRRRSGKTAAAIKTSRNYRPNEGLVIAKVSIDKRRRYIANFLEYGTAAHKIWTKGKGSLVVNGVAIGRQVDHPGTAPMAFFRPAVDAKASEAVQVVGEYLTRYLRFGAIEVPEVAVDSLEEAA